MEIEVVDIEGKKALGIVMEMNEAPLVLVKAEKGFIMCGLLDMDTANAIGEVCAKLKGVKNLQEILDKEVREVSDEAKKLGVREGMSGKEALLVMFE